MNEPHEPRRHDKTAPGSFPKGGYERHHLGRFGEKVLAFLGEPESIGKFGDHDVYIFVDAVELGDNPYQEEIRVRFHVSWTPVPSDHAPYWGAFPPAEVVEVILTPEMEPVLNDPRLAFTFSSALTFDENIEDFMAFFETESNRGIVSTDSSAGKNETMFEGLDKFAKIMERRFVSKTLLEAKGRTE